MLSMSKSEKIINKLKWLSHFIYFYQIKLEIPKEIISNCKDCKLDLPDGYTLCSPEINDDLEEWVKLLNSDGNFGYWTLESVKSEILDKLILPDAASLLLYKNKIVGSMATYEIPSRRNRVGMIMWVIIDKEHRGKHLSYPLFCRTFNYFNYKAYNKIIITSDSYRYIALRFYLKIGAKPLYDSFCSFFQWWNTKRKLNRFLRESERNTHKNSR
jgi:hypothetical protein